MTISEKLLQRFKELSDQTARFRVHQRGEGYIIFEPEDWQRWAASGSHLIESTFGEGSTYARRFSAIYEHCGGYGDNIRAMKGILEAAWTDYECGFATSLPVLVSGEVYGDFVSLSKHCLSDGSKDVAAVLACAALEHALKRFGAVNGLDVQTKSMQEVVAALKAAGLVSGAQKSLLDSMPKIRDYAMHANWDKISSQDVGSVLGFVEQFLISHFS